MYYVVNTKKKGPQIVGHRPTNHVVANLKTVSGDSNILPTDVQHMTSKHLSIQSFAPSDLAG